MIVLAILLWLIVGWQLLAFINLCAVVRSRKVIAVNTAITVAVCIILTIAGGVVISQ